MRACVWLREAHARLRTRKRSFSRGRRATTWCPIWGHARPRDHSPSPFLFRVSASVCRRSLSLSLSFSPFLSFLTLFASFRKLSSSSSSSSSKPVQSALCRLFSIEGFAAIRRQFQYLDCIYWTKRKGLVYLKAREFVIITTNIGRR